MLTKPEQQKEQDRIRREELRKEERQTRELERQARAEKKRVAKEGQQKGKEVVPPLNLAGPIVEKPTEKQPDPEADEPTKGRTRALTVNFKKRHWRHKSTDSIEKKLAKNTSSDSIDKVSVQGSKPNSSPSKLKKWLQNLSRPRSNSSPVGAVTDQAEAPKKGFLGGVALARLTGKDDKALTANDGASASMREVALAGRHDESEVLGESSKTTGLRAGDRTPSPGPRDADSTSLSTRSVSSMSSSLDEFEEARTTLNSPISPITPPRNNLRIGTEVDASPVRGSRFSEILE